MSLLTPELSSRVKALYTQALHSGDMATANLCSQALRGDLSATLSLTYMLEASDHNPKPLDWRPVAVNHWVTTLPDGQPISLSIWPDGWILCRWPHKQPCLRFENRKQALKYLGLKPIR